jgi:acylphosphatase
VRERAEASSLSGWVRNLRDGSVELEVEGPVETVAAFVKEVREGPPGSQVVGIEQNEISPRNAPGFEIR